MKLRWFLYGMLAVILPVAAYLSLRPSIDRITIAEASKLLDLSFTGPEARQMLGNLREQPEGFHGLRSTGIDNGIAPPLYFDPTPPGKIYDLPPTRRISLTPLATDLTRRPEDLSQLAFASVRELSHLVRTRQVSSLELTQLFLERLKSHGPELESVVSLTEERALAQARERDRELARGIYRGPLHGIPWGVKDLFAVQGTVTSWGATPYKDQTIEQTASIVRNLDEAGAVLVAKLTLGALAYGDIWFGGRTNNPWDLQQGSSGSSAGSAASVVAGLVPFTIGTETLGSIVSPSIRTGATGLRPTFGRVSRHGGMALSWSMDKVGPITRSVEDAALVFEAIKGPDGYDLTVKDLPFGYQRRSDLKGLRIGVPEGAFEGDSPASAFYEQSLQTLRDLGAELVPMQLPDLPLDGMFNLLTAEAAAAFDDFTREGLDDQMKWQEDQAWPNSFRSVRFYPAVEWIQLNRIRMMLIQQMDEAISDVDLYVTPPFWGQNLLITNLTGHPAVVLPIGFSEQGRPAGITFIGHLYDEKTILEVGHVFQEAGGVHRIHPPRFLP